MFCVYAAASPKSVSSESGNNISSSLGKNSTPKPGNYRIIVSIDLYFHFRTKYSSKDFMLMTIQKVWWLYNNVIWYTTAGKLIEQYIVVSKFKSFTIIHSWDCFLAKNQMQQTTAVMVWVVADHL